MRDEGIRIRGKRQPLLIVPVEVNGVGPFPFLVDTGASQTILTRATAEASGVLKTAHKPKAIGVGGAVKAGLGRANAFQVGSQLVKRLEVAFVDLSHVENTLGIQVAGIIGYNFLKRYVVTIDYPRRMLYLRRPRGR